MKAIKSRIGKPILTTSELLDAVTNKEWIVIKANPNNTIGFTAVAAAFINRRFIEVIEMMQDKRLYKYKKK